MLADELFGAQERSCVGEAQLRCGRRAVRVDVRERSECLDERRCRGRRVVVCTLGGSERMERSETDCELARVDGAVSIGIEGVKERLAHEARAQAVHSRRQDAGDLRVDSGISSGELAVHLWGEQGA